MPWEALLPFSPTYLDGLFGDPEIAAHVGAPAAIRSMLDVEGRLAKVEGALGIIPVASAEAIAAAADVLEIDLGELALATARDGVPVPELVSRLRNAVGTVHADHVHVGPTSQDVVDTAFVLTSRSALAILDARLEALVEAIAGLAEEHMRTLMAARTRFQVASPTTFGLKAAGWALPLHRHRSRLAELGRRLFSLSFAGASGTLASLGPSGPAVEAALAGELGLAVPAGSWHSARDNLAELGGWLALVTGSLGKIGLDLLLLAQNEVGEVSLGAGGASSTMPHKANPIEAEGLVSLARVNADRASSLHHAMLHAQERDGAAWASEWMILPEMMVAAGAATRLATRLVEVLRVDAGRMAARLSEPPGLLLSEPAVASLAQAMPRHEAVSLVRAAAARARERQMTLIDVLEESLGPIVDWHRLRSMQETLDAAALRTRRILNELRQPL